MNHRDVLIQFLPASFYGHAAPNLNTELNAEGNALDAALTSVDQLLLEMRPTTCMYTLKDWERNYGLPESGVGLQSVDQRRVALASKVAAVGGQSAAYFIDVATSLGYTNVSITEFNVTTCNTNCNAALYADAALFQWQVNIPLVGAVISANCNSSCDAPLQSWGDHVLEAVLNKIKPAHTVLLFNYF